MTVESLSYNVSRESVNNRPVAAGISVVFTDFGDIVKDDTVISGPLMKVCKGCKAIGSCARSVDGKRFRAHVAFKNGVPYPGEYNTDANCVPSVIIPHSD